MLVLAEGLSLSANFFLTFLGVTSGCSAWTISEKNMKAYSLGKCQMSFDPLSFVVLAEGLSLSANFFLTLRGVPSWCSAWTISLKKI